MDKIEQIGEIFDAIEQERSMEFAYALCGALDVYRVQYNRPDFKLSYIMGEESFHENVMGALYECWAEDVNWTRMASIIEEHRLMFVQE